MRPMMTAPVRLLSVASAAANEQRHRGYGATAARLTPDQKVGNSNLSALISCVFRPALTTRGASNSQELEAVVEGAKARTSTHQKNQDTAKTKFHLAKKIFKS